MKKGSDFCRSRVDFPTSFTGPSFTETQKLKPDEHIKHGCPHILRYCVRYVNQRDRSELSGISGVDTELGDRYVGYSVSPDNRWFLHDGADVLPVDYTTHVKQKPMTAFIYERTSRF